MIEQKFAFDLELLIRTQLRRPGSITRREPVEFVEFQGVSARELDEASSL